METIYDAVTDTLNGDEQIRIIGGSTKANINSGPTGVIFDPIISNDFFKDTFTRYTFDLTERCMTNVFATAHDNDVTVKPPMDTYVDICEVTLPVSDESGASSVIFGKVVARFLDKTDVTIYYLRAEADSEFKVDDVALSKILLRHPHDAPVTEALKELQVPNHDSADGLMRTLTTIIGTTYITDDLHSAILNTASVKNRIFNVIDPTINLQNNLRINRYLYDYIRGSVPYEEMQEFFANVEGKVFDVDLISERYYSAYTKGTETLMSHSVDKDNVGKAEEKTTASKANENNGGTNPIVKGMMMMYVANEEFKSQGMLASNKLKQLNETFKGRLNGLHYDELLLAEFFKKIGVVTELFDSVALHAIILELNRLASSVIVDSDIMRANIDAAIRGHARPSVGTIDNSVHQPHHRYPHQQQTHYQPQQQQQYQPYQQHGSFQQQTHATRNVQHEQNRYTPSMNTPQQMPNQHRVYPNSNDPQLLHVMNEFNRNMSVGIQQMNSAINRLMSNNNGFN